MQAWGIKPNSSSILFICAVPKEGRESMADGEGRWFPFNISLDCALVMLEKKDLPGHLASMNCVDTTATLGSVLLELQDAGEAGFSHPQCAPLDLYD